MDDKPVTERAAALRNPAQPAGNQPGAAAGAALALRGRVLDGRRDDGGGGAAVGGPGDVELPTAEHRGERAGEGEVVVGVLCGQVEVRHGGLRDRRVCTSKRHKV